MVTDWAATFDEFEETTDEIRDLGKPEFSSCLQRGRGARKVASRSAAVRLAYELRGSRITRLTTYGDAAAALKAADLSK